MYREAAKRLLIGAISRGNLNPPLRLPPLRTFFNHSLYSTAPESQPFSDTQIPTQYLHKENHGFSDSSASSSYSSSNSSHSSTTEEAKGSETGRGEYKEEKARVLQASLPHVVSLGWTEAAMIAGARDLGISPSIVGSFPRKEAALVEFFMDDCLQKLIDRVDSEDDMTDLIPSEAISKLVRIRLEMQAPYISKWPQALSIQAQPANVPTSFKQRAMLVDEIWNAANDNTSDIEWYVKRTILGGLYSTTEIYMLTDSSPEFRNTWVFLDNRVKDAFDLKKTIQEAKYLAEAVGAGMGGSLQGFLKKVVRV